MYTAVCHTNMYDDHVTHTQAQTPWQQPERERERGGGVMRTAVL